MQSAWFCCIADKLVRNSAWLLHHVDDRNDKPYKYLCERHSAESSLSNENARSLKIRCTSVWVQRLRKSTSFLVCGLPMLLRIF